MRRIYLLWLWRQIFNPFVVESVGLVLSVWYLATVVSVTDVLSNAFVNWSGFSGAYHFFLSAALNTELTVQALALFLIILTGFLLRDSWRFILLRRIPRSLLRG